ncbi:MAG: peptidase [Bacteroidia bacterium]|nr:peptidase [Bacteroidia bacterium]
MRSFVFVVTLLHLLVSFSCKKKKSQDPESPNLSSSHFLLSDDNYTKLQVEIQYIEGYQPRTETLASLKSFMQQRMNKPDGIEFTTRVIPSGLRPNYSLEDIRAIEKTYRTSNGSGKTISAYFLFLDKDYSENAGSYSKVLGIHYGPTSIVVFENVIRQFSGGVTQPKLYDLETAVTEHEIGHMLGLTNHRSPMQTDHEDKDHPAHCNNTECLMYYASETSDIVANLVGNPVPALDSNCLNDLRANGGK